MDDEENYTGCLICVHGRYLEADADRLTVRCELYGIVKERTQCEGFKSQPISQVDPFNLPE